jgi:hypothetical protein
MPGSLRRSLTLTPCVERVDVRVASRMADAGSPRLQIRSASPDDPSMRTVGIVVLALLPSVVAGLFVFGGGQVQRCLALTCPPPPPRPTYPLIGAIDPALALTVLLAVVWIVLALATLAVLITSDRSRLARIVTVLVVTCTVVAAIAALATRLDGDRWRTVAETAALSAAAVAYLLLPPLLAWAAATRRRI